MFSLQEMQPYYAAARHNLYTKTTYVYLQQMVPLQTDHPDIYALFLMVYMLLAALIDFKLVFQLIW